MKRFLSAPSAMIALCAATVAAAETCPPLPQAPDIDPQEEVMLPNNPPQVPAPRRHTPMPEAPPEAIHIKLTRAYCGDNCELASSVELRGDGEGVYRGERFDVLVKGEHRFPVAPGAVACLMGDFRAADFWSLAPAYTVDEPGLAISTLEIEAAGQHKTVKERVGVRVGAPTALARLELAVEAAGAQSYLVGDANTVPLLQAERFDFRSRAGAVLLDSAANLSPDAVVLAILAQGAPANQKVLTVGFSDNSAVAASARRGKLDLVRAMVAAGAFKDAPYQMREDALRAAIEDAWPAVVDELIKDGADLQARGEEGEAILNHLGANSLSARKIEDPTFRADRVTVIKLLIAAGAPIPRTIMFHAEAPEEVRLFLAAGADLEAKNDEGETPLLATYDEDVAIALLEAGADRNAKDEDGKTIIDKAANKDAGIPRVRAWLRAHPTDVR
jgi:ankyrin repeat protein